MQFETESPAHGHRSYVLPSPGSAGSAYGSMGSPTVLPQIADNQRRGAKPLADRNTRQGALRGGGTYGAYPAGTPAFYQKANSR